MLINLYYDKISKCYRCYNSNEPDIIMKKFKNKEYEILKSVFDSVFKKTKQFELEENEFKKDLLRIYFND